MKVYLLTPVSVHQRDNMWTSLSHHQHTVFSFLVTCVHQRDNMWTSLINQHWFSYSDLLQWSKGQWFKSIGVTNLNIEWSWEAYIYFIIVWKLISLSYRITDTQAALHICMYIRIWEIALYRLHKQEWGIPRITDMTQCDVQVMSLTHYGLKNKHKPGI